MAFLNKQKTKNDEYSDLLNDIKVLADYAEDHKIDLDAVGNARKLLLSTPSEPSLLNDEISSNPNLDDDLVDTKIALTKSICSKGYEKVTIETLRATRSVDGKRTLFTTTGAYLIFLWAVMLSLVATAIYFQYNLDNFVANTPIGDASESSDTAKIMLMDAISPFLYGTLGACVYLMRVTSTKLRARTFNPSRYPEHINRLLLGTVSGGIIIILLEDSMSIGAAGEGVPITAAGIGFIAGYSIEFLYQTVDRIINAILPYIKESFDPKILEDKKKAILISRYKKDLEKAINTKQSPQVIDTLKQIIEDLD